MICKKCGKWFFSFKTKPYCKPCEKLLVYGQHTITQSPFRQAVNPVAPMGRDFGIEINGLKMKSVGVADIEILDQTNRFEFTGHFESDDLFQGGESGSGGASRSFDFEPDNNDLGGSNSDSDSSDSGSSDCGSSD